MYSQLTGEMQTFLNGRQVSLDNFQLFNKFYPSRRQTHFRLDYLYQVKGLLSGWKMDRFKKKFFSDYICKRYFSAIIRI